MSSPLVSVVMPVYNGEKYLAEAIESILAQTFTDFEFLIVDDGSTDTTPIILAEYARKDSRIKIVSNEKNSGVAVSLNRGIELARGEYVARMDADDVSLPHRLATQIDFFNRHHEVAVSGSFLTIYETGNKWEAPLDSKDIAIHLLFNCPIFHPTVMFRRVLVANSENNYHDSALHAEDYDLWARLSLQQGFSFANISEPLLRYRVHPDRPTKAAYKESQRKTADNVRKMLLARLGIVPIEEEYRCHEIFYTYSTVHDNAMLRRCGRWLDKIFINNKKHKIYNEEVLGDFLLSLWRDLCWRSELKGVLHAIAYCGSSLVKLNRENMRFSRGLLGF